MLRAGLVLFLCVLPFIDGTPVACSKRFIKLYTSIDHKVSDCRVLSILKGFQYNLQVCQETACREGGNVINFKETKDEFDDDECQIRLCENGDLKLVPSEDNFSVLLNDEEPMNECSEQAGRLLSCWTCTDAEDEEECQRKGSYEPCLMQEAKCAQYIETDEKGITYKVSRGCIKGEDCKASMWGKIGECHRIDYPEYPDEVISGCRHCGYGFYGRHHRCYPVQPNLAQAKKFEYQHAWAHIFHHSAGKGTACPMIAQEENGYTFDSCQRLAIALGGNVVAFRYNRFCSVHKCEVTGAGIADLMLEDHDHGYGIWTFAQDFPCSKQLDRTLSCWTCDSEDEKSCRRSGRMLDCAEDHDTCLLRKTVNMFDEEVRVVRSCGKSNHCTNQMWNPDDESTCVKGEDGTKTCETCYYGKPGADHGCHANFDKQCIAQFKEVKEDKSDKAVTPTCLQVTNQDYHWLESCLNLACMTNANVVHFGNSCELYTCKLGKNEKPVFRNRRGHHMRFFVMK